MARGCRSDFCSVTYGGDVAQVCEKVAACIPSYSNDGVGLQCCKAALRAMSMHG